MLRELRSAWKAQNRGSIDQRPTIVDTRQLLGDCKFDTINGKGHHYAIVSLTKRTSHLALLGKAGHKIDRAVVDAVIEILKSGWSAPI